MLFNRELKVVGCMFAISICVAAICFVVFAIFSYSPDYDCVMDTFDDEDYELIREIFQFHDEIELIRLYYSTGRDSTATLTFSAGEDYHCDSRGHSDRWHSFKKLVSSDGETIYTCSIERPNPALREMAMTKGVRVG